MQNTFKHIISYQYDEHIIGPDITEDIILLEDHFPYYKIENNLSREDQCAKHYGQNMLLENCHDPHSKIWIYDSYLYSDSTKNNIYIPNLTLNVQGYKNNESPKIDRKYKFICLNNKPRFHRVLSSVWINKNFISGEYYYTANFNSDIPQFLEFIDFPGPGLPKRVVDLPLGDFMEINTAKFFKDTFYPHASNSVFSIVNEVSFFEHACHLSEKTLWAILGYNIPIVSGYGMATYMERIGFDMFRDIVNYSSEFIKDPFLRTQRLLDDNLEVLKNAHDVLTPEILQRLEYNYHLQQRAEITKHAVEKLNTPEMLAKLDEILYNIEHMKNTYNRYR